MYFRLAFALFLSGILLSSATSAFGGSRDDSAPSEKRGHKSSVSNDEDTGHSRSGYIIASS